MSINLFTELGKICNRIATNRTGYKQYCNITKNWNARLNEYSCTKIEIGNTAKSIVKKNGFEKETLETLQTTEFTEAFHSFLKEKGYEMPKKIEFWEHMLPRKSGVVGLQMKRSIIYNPRCINTLDFRVPIHETGHLERHLFPISFAMGHDNRLFFVGKLLKKIPVVKNLFKEHTLCHLSKEEQIALKSDYARAYKEGYFKHNPFYKRAQENILSTKQPTKAKKLDRYYKTAAKDYKKNPENYYMPNSQQNREEFIADYFNLAAQGFEFSPIVTAKYLKYGSPKVSDIITSEGLENLENLRKQISKKSLNDYGYVWQA